MDLIDTFRNHSKILAAKSAALESIHHAGDRGNEREDVLDEFLKPLLPQKLAIGRGEIRATNGAWSKQEDLVIYDRLSCPRLFVGTRSQVFPVESVAAVIEVKTKLTTKAIREATQNISQARSLKKVGSSTHIGPGDITFGEPTPIFGALFAFDSGVSPNTFRKTWDTIQSAQPPERRINLTCILGKTVTIHIDRTFHLWDSASEAQLGSFYCIDCGQDALLTFILDLMRVLAECRFGVPDLFKYYFSGGERLKFKNAFQE